MKLEDIGFYSLRDERAATSTRRTRLERCELLLTKRCNFNCKYCRHVGPPDATWEEAKGVVDFWKAERCRNMRFSGGEPTLWPDLERLVSYAWKDNNDLEHVALSTNGSADIGQYVDLVRAGVNDFSISLDACCAATAGAMMGTQGNMVKHVMSIIRVLAELTYVTIGTVVTPDNLSEVRKVVEWALTTDVADVRIIPSAQWNEQIDIDLPFEAIEKYPILRYRYERMKQGLHVRGMWVGDSHKCRLALDDMAVSNGKHYPCIIHMREGGKPIGDMSGDVRLARQRWADTHNCYMDPICEQNCLDVCVAYNNKAHKLRALARNVV